MIGGASAKKSNCCQRGLAAPVDLPSRSTQQIRASAASGRTCPPGIGWSAFVVGNSEITRFSALFQGGRPTGNLATNRPAVLNPNSLVQPRTDREPIATTASGANSGKGQNTAPSTLHHSTQAGGLRSAVHCPMRTITNSAGFTGATPTTHTNCPLSRSFCVIVVRSHRT